VNFLGLVLCPDGRIEGMKAIQSWPPQKDFALLMATCHVVRLWSLTSLEMAMNGKTFSESPRRDATTAVSPLRIQTDLNTSSTVRSNSCRSNGLAMVLTLGVAQQKLRPEFVETKRAAAEVEEILVVGDLSLVHGNSIEAPLALALLFQESGPSQDSQVFRDVVLRYVKLLDDFVYAQLFVE
jgi:hypothetical protein